MTLNIKKIKDQHISTNTKKLVYRFVKENVNELKLINIPEVIIKLFILYIHQIDRFIYHSLNPFNSIRDNFGFVLINNFQTIMRNDVNIYSFKEIYGSTLIQLSYNFHHRICHSWKVEINNIPSYSDNHQSILGICNKETDIEDKPLNHYHYYGIDNKFNHSYKNMNNHVKIKYVNISHFQGRNITKYDIITIEVTKWYNDIHLNFYVNDILCMTYFNVENISYRLFVSTNTMFVCCSLKHYECVILDE